MRWEIGIFKVEKELKIIESNPTPFLTDVEFKDKLVILAFDEASTLNDIKTIYGIPLLRWMRLAARTVYLRTKIRIFLLLLIHLLK
jgi:hypothetical protein